MSGRTIAEILGWTYREVEFVEHDVVSIVVLPFGPDGERLIRPQGPTVDDLLAWLDAQGFPVGVAYGNGACDVISLGLRRKLPTFTAPTLLAALEAAVRAVAGEDEQ